MKVQYLFLAAASLVACAACSKTVEQPEGEESQMTYRAYQEGLQETKTTVQDGGTLVYWEPADEIKVFFKSFTGRFVSQNNEPAGVADFSGTLNVLVGANEGFEASNQAWGLYPYRADAAFDGENVTTTLSAAQTGKAGSFAKGTHICLARSGGLDLAFYNVTGGLRFSLTQEGIKSVTFEGNGSEALAGRIKMAFAEGVPAIREIAESQTVITLTAPDGGTFETGQWYYIEAIPGTLSKGFKMAFAKDGETATLTSQASVTISRGHYGSLADADEELIFKDGGGGEAGGGTIGEPIDLGLSVKWASWNVGASRPEESGDYFAWGETEPKSDYSWKTYKWCNGAYNKLTKYCHSDKTDYWGGSGSPDGKTVLDLEDDAASVNWGGSWRMHTDAEWIELQENCTWTWTDNYNGTGVAGQIVTSKKTGYTNQSIFLPAAGGMRDTRLDAFGSHGEHWSSSALNNEYPFNATKVGFSSDFVSRGGGNFRCYGSSVRPVDGASVSSVTLDRTSLTLNPGNIIQLTATISPETALDKTVFWNSSNPSVASVNKEGLVIAHEEGTATITVTTQDGARTATCTVKVIAPNGEAVDLGLSVKWASYNVGASKPEEYGDYFAWGETEQKSDYSRETYKWCNGPVVDFTKYCPTYKTDYWGGSGYPDGKTILDSEDDAARVNWGDNWRIPTYEEWSELINNCNWTWKYDYNRTGIQGYVVTGKKSGYTDNSIFLPAAGYRGGTSIYPNGGSYWSTALYEREPNYARCPGFDARGVGATSISDRARGCSIRPVTK